MEPFHISIPGSKRFEKTSLSKYFPPELLCRVDFFTVSEVRQNENTALNEIINNMTATIKVMILPENIPMPVLSQYLYLYFVLYLIQGYIRSIS